MLLVLILTNDFYLNLLNWNNYWAFVQLCYTAIFGLSIFRPKRDFCSSYVDFSTNS